MAESLNHIDGFFHDVYDYILNHGDLKGDRTGVGTLSTFAITGRFSLRDRAFPIPSTKLMRTKSFMHETLLFVSGKSSIKYLRDNKVGIWDQWFIPGTDVYDEPREPYTLQERIELIKERDLTSELLAYIKTLPVVQRDGTETIIKLLDIDEVVRVTGIGINKVHVQNIQVWMNTRNIPQYKEPGGTPIGLKKRLTRVSKNDTVKWDRLNAIINEDWEKLNSNQIGADLLAEGDDVEITVYAEGEFKNVSIRPLTAVCLAVTLDKMKVSNYPLLDADIGQGSYPVQWRGWQDTQIVQPNDIKAYLAQGYVHKGWLSNGMYDDGVAVMHRDIDQLQNAINTLKSNPDDRRIIVNAWNPGRIWQAALPPCHLYFQFRTSLKSFDDLISNYVDLPRGELDEMFAALSIAMPELSNLDLVIAAYAKQDKVLLQWLHDYGQREEIGVNIRRLSCIVVLRSADFALGQPFNIGQYAMLTHMVAHVVGMDPDELVTVSVDAHLYLNQIEGIEEQLTRDSIPRSNPRLYINRKVDSIDDFKFEDFEIRDYLSHPEIKMDVAI